MASYQGNQASNQPESGFSITGAVGTGASMWFANPAVYSYSKGVMLPIGSKVWDSIKNFDGKKKALKSLWARKDIGGFGKTLRTIGGGFKSLGGPGFVGTGVVDNYERMKPGLRVFDDEIRGYNKQIRYNKKGLKKAQKFYNKRNFSAKLLDATNVDNPQSIDSIQKIVKKRAPYINYINKKNKIISEYEKKISDVAVKRAEYAGKMLAGKALKYGLFTAKVVSTIGVMQIGWELAKMVAEPLGKAVGDTTNSILNAYHNRFSPELGGKLAMSYLSYGAATERQRAIEAISRAHLNGRAAIGQEAMYSHG